MTTGKTVDVGYPPRYRRPMKYPTAILVRLTPKQKALFAAVADAAGVSVAEWIRGVCDRAARETP